MFAVKFTKLSMLLSKPKRDVLATGPERETESKRGHVFLKRGVWEWDYCLTFTPYRVSVMNTSLDISSIKSQISYLRNQRN